MKAGQKVGDKRTPKGERLGAHGQTRMFRFGLVWGKKGVDDTFRAEGGGSTKWLGCSCGFPWTPQLKGPKLVISLWCPLPPKDPQKNPRLTHGGPEPHRRDPGDRGGGASWQGGSRGNGGHHKSPWGPSRLTGIAVDLGMAQKTGTKMACPGKHGPTPAPA